MSKTIIMEPFGRVEGDLKININVQDSVVTDAKVSGIMFRGFEKMLSGHVPEDVLVYLPRICGICSISHSVAGSSLLASVSEDFKISKNGQFAKNIIHAVENVMSHITQFYIYFAPDLANKKYKRMKDYGLIERSFLPITGESVNMIMNERKRFLEIVGIIGGKWPHNLAVHPGGVTHSLNSSEIFRIQGLLTQFIKFIEPLLFGMRLDDFLKIETVSELETKLFKGSRSLSDLALFYSFAQEIGLFNMGKTQGKFLSGGVYHEEDGSLLIRSGYWDGQYHNFNVNEITESIAYSFFDRENPSTSPFDDYSTPVMNKEKAYSWAKAPRYKDNVVEVGALARSIVSGDVLIHEMFSKFGSTVFTRVFARIHESAKILKAMVRWSTELTTTDDSNLPGASSSNDYFVKTKLKENAVGYGITEAARGFLGHWMSVKEGKICNMQVITPTAWNASPMDEKERHGAMESALISTQITDESNSIEVEHIIRSFDPCLVCTVH